MKISSIILISFFFILVLFSITTYINYKQSELVNENSDKFAKSSIIIRYSNRYQRNFLNAVSGLRGYLLTNEISFLQTYDSAIVENEEILKDLILLTPEKTNQKQILTDIYGLNEYWHKEFAIPLLEAKRLITLSDSSRNAFNKLYKAKLNNGVEKNTRNSLQRKFAEFSNYEYEFRDFQKEFLTKEVKKTKNISVYLTVISLIAGGCISVFLAMYISSRILKMVKMANTIASGNYEVYILEKGNSELSQLAKALNSMAKTLGTHISKLKRQRDELDQFAHIVSHDLKAPLRGIDNVVTWIEEDHNFELPPKVNEFLKIIKHRIVRAENLLKAILMYARIGKESRVQERVSVNELIEEVVGYIHRKPGISFIAKPDLPIFYTERLPLLQIFSNLIVNAFKYHDKENGEVKVYYKDLGDKYEFFIEDDGPGIDSKYHRKIFIIFQTLEENDIVESTGVGLAIVKKILDDRGLKINLISEPGRGSIFSFTWPKT